MSRGWVLVFMLATYLAGALGGMAFLAYRQSSAAKPKPRPVVECHAPVQKCRVCHSSERR